MLSNPLSDSDVANLVTIERLLSTPDLSLDTPAQYVDFVNLFQSATERGAVLSSLRHGRDDHGGRGLFTTRNVHPGDI